MENIFDLFMQKKISGDSLVKDAYSSFHDIKAEWVVDIDGLSIQELINKICDDLEKEGHDLHQTHVDIVKSRFKEYKISIEVPKEVVQLRDAVKIAEKTFLSLIEFNAPPEILELAKSTVNKLISELKELT